MMSAYNSVNGEWCGENHQLLTDILRAQWGFDGFVISDWIFGLRDPVKSVRNGLDIEMPFRQQRFQHLRPALEASTLTEADIDAPVRRTVATMLRFDDILSRPAPDEAIAASDAHRELAYEAAVKSIVLLKNDDVLPLDVEATGRIAVLGRLASVPNLGDRGSSNVVPPSVDTPLDGLRAALPDATFLVEDGSDLDAAKRAAESADVAIVVVGCTYQDEGEYISAQPELLMATAPPRPAMPPRPERPTREERSAGERPQPGWSGGGDRASLDLSDTDQALVKAVASANARTIVVLMGGSAIMVEAWHESVPAIVMLWYPGMEGGRALSDIIIGKANPSGRLPFAVPTNAAHLPHFDREATSITYDLFHGQWLLDKSAHKARYPFGFGLSYARATLRDTTVDVGEAEITVSAELVNDGDRDATEVVQVYAGARGDGVERPIWRLAAFARTDVPKGSTTHVRIVFPFERLAVRIEGVWVIEPGPYDIAVGLHAHDPKAAVTRIHAPG